MKSLRHRSERRLHRRPFVRQQVSRIPRIAETAGFPEIARVRKEIRTEETARKEIRTEETVRAVADLIIKTAREDHRDRIVRRDRAVRKVTITADLVNVRITVRKAADLTITETV